MTSTQSPNDEALPPDARRALRAIFLTLFLDLAGFSIIFPLFPGMLSHYEAVEGNAGLFGFFHGLLTQFSEWAGAPGGWGVIVLFGGMLGSIYSLLQFACAPVFGAVSDRVGRKPVLLFAIAGLLLSYVLWFFAGSFVVLVLSRVLGGIMSANLSTASAVVADVTTPRTRPKGMAFFGIAYGLGFICGPALGGISAGLDLSAHFPALAAWGVNPYSMPAAIAAVLTAANLVFVAVAFRETLPSAGAASDAARRPVNPLVLFRAARYPGVTRANWSYFAFLLAFSGMEFSLTFLAAERLGFGPRDNAMMFLFIGVVLAGIQGGYVQRHAGRVGARTMALRGLALAAPALGCIGIAGAAQSGPVLFLGLLLLTASAALTMPCLTALVSLYAPADDQGRVLGEFRAMGALARALGPLAACLLYWRLGSTACYLIGAGFVLLPVFMARALPTGPATAPSPAAG